MDGRSRQRGIASLLALLAMAGCTRGDAGEAEDTPAPGVGEAARSAPDPRAGSDPAPPTPPPVVVAEGTALIFTVDEAISTDTQKQGDPFMGTLAEAVLGADGAPLLEAGTAGRWVVTESTARNAEGEAVLAVALEAVQVDGSWVPVSATVTDIALKTDTPDSDRETAAKIGIGAAAGALAGKVLGGSTEATLKGAGAGAAIGTAVALATRGGSASIRQGSRITVRLDGRLELPGR